MISRFFFLLLLLIPAIAHADLEGQPPPADCAPQKAEDLPRWRDWIAHFGPNWFEPEREEEAQRIARDVGVFRYLDRLYLARDDDDGLVTVIDCPYRDSMALHIYEHLDGWGRFYVVRRQEYENLYYLLVSQKSGLTFAFSSVPAWSPDRTRFVTGRCDALNGPDSIAITRRSGDGFRTEATVSLPCNGGECRFAWVTDSEIAGSCTSEASNVERPFRVARRGDDWTLTPN